jgi:hypothetical protein
MTTAGILFMTLSLTFVWGLALWCFRKVLAAPAEPPKQVEDFHSA